MDSTKQEVLSAQVRHGTGAGDILRREQFSVAAALYIVQLHKRYTVRSTGTLFPLLGAIF